MENVFNIFMIIIVIRIYINVYILTTDYRFVFRSLYRDGLNGRFNQLEIILMVDMDWDFDMDCDFVKKAERMLSMFRVLQFMNTVHKTNQ